MSIEKVVIGDATLYLQDRMEFMRSIGDNEFDLAIIDPEYGRGEDGGTKRNTKVKQKNGTTIDAFDGGYSNKKWDKVCAPKEFFDEVVRVSKRQIIWGCNYQDYEFPKGRIVWDKVNDGSDQSDCEIASCSFNNEKVELIRYMWRGMLQGVSAKNGMIQQGNKQKNEKRIHPTQKPVILCDWILRTYAEKEWKLFDAGIGSGSLFIAALALGFSIVGCENDSEYFKSAIERIEEAQRQQRFNF